MNFKLSASIEILERTPGVLDNLLGGLSGDWTQPNEGPDTWSAYDIIGHLIHGEKTDWIPRMNIILSENTEKTFIPFDRFAQFRNSKGKSLKELLNEFSRLRKENLQYLKFKKLDKGDLQKEGAHPELGPVTLEQLLASWVVHDLNHIAQICRVMAYQYKEEVGPWQAYMGILNR